MTTKAKAPCGSPGGAARHRRDGENPCEACAKTARERQRRYRAGERIKPEPRPLDADFRWDVHERHPEWFGAVAS